MDLSIMPQPVELQSNQTWKQIEGEISKLPMMSHPNITVIVTSVYLLLVLVIAPSYMKNRKPYELRNILIVYNVLQVFFSVFLVYKGLLVGCPVRDLLSPVCHHRMNFDIEKQIFVMSNAWWYLCAKVTEMVETLFFILRKKYNQVSFLHLYHHVSTFVISWFVLKYAPEEYTLMTMILNSIVHVLMYTYYALTAMGPNYQKYLWWKKYITAIQITQFLIFVVYLLLAKYSNCGYSNTTINILIINMLFLTSLFYHFYKSNYKHKNE